MSSVPLPAAGDTIAGRFVVERKLGEGGMGAVFAARSISIGKPVAIKVMLADPAHPESFQRFLNEGRNAGNIRNPHVADVDEVGEERGFAFMVMELLEGEDLAQVLERERQLAPQVAVSYVLQALEGVKAAHLKGIVHRDLKPSNLFLSRNADGSTTVKVLDFGISKSSSALGQAPSSLTSTKAMLGSPLYVSPEQVRSSKNVDARTDIWAIGVILYELLTGDLPFMGDNLGELFAAILEEAPVPLRTRAPAVPPGLEEIVLRCLEKRPDNRLQTAQDVIEALRPFGAVQQGTVVLGVQSPFAHGAPAPVSPGAQTRPGAITGGGPPLGSAPPGAMQPPPGMGGVTPYPMMMMTPPGGAITGSGVHPPVVTPQTGDWAQSTGGGAMIPAKSSAPLMLGVAGVLVVAAAVGIGLIWKSSTASTKPGTPATLTSGASAEPPPVSATASPAVPATVATAPAAEPSGATAPAATVAAKPSAKPAVPAVTKDEPKPVVVKPAEPKPADPKPADPKPAASAKPATTGNPSGIQDYR